MHFGLFFDIVVGDSYSDRIGQSIRLLELAERHGLESVWCGETYGDNPTQGEHGRPPTAPIFLSMLMRSTGLTLGTSVALLPAVAPLRFAYETAVIDQLSNGRLVLGVAPGRAALQRRFGLDVSSIGEWTDELIEMLRALWSGAPGFKGRHLQIEGGIDPLPYQVGGPPIWVGGYTRRSAKRAAEHGQGVLLGTRPSVDLVRRQSATYHAALRERGAPESEGVVAVIRHVLVAPSRSEAMDLARQHLAKKVWWAAETGSLRPPPSRPGMTGSELVDELHERYYLIGSPEDVTERIAAYRQAGVSHIILRPAAGIPVAIAARTIELLGTEVLPAVRARRGQG